jgi:hypothetical protein
VQAVFYGFALRVEQFFQGHHVNIGEKGHGGIFWGMCSKIGIISEPTNPKGKARGIIEL